MAYVYRHIRLDKNEPFYIGIGSDNEGCYRRANYKYGRNNLWNNIVKKSDFRVDIVIDNLSWEEACKKEKELILLYGRINLNNGILCNFTDGGEGVLGAVFSNERLAKMSAAMKGKLAKDKHPLFGKHHTNETRNKISESKIGKKMSPERLAKHSITFSGNKNPMFGKTHSSYTKDIIRQKKIGAKHSEETKLKMSTNNIGINNPNYGNKYSNETKLKMSQNSTIKVCVYNTESGVMYDSILEASKAYNISYDMLKLKLSGKCKNNTYLKRA